MLCNYRACNVYFGQCAIFLSRFHMYRILTLVTWLVDVLTGDLRYRPQLTGQESGLRSHGKYSTLQECAASIILDAWSGTKISGRVLKATCSNWSNDCRFSTVLILPRVAAKWCPWNMEKCPQIDFPEVKINYIVDNSCWMGVSCRPTIPTSVNRAWWVQVLEDNIGVLLCIEDKNSWVSICGPCRGHI